ncbi:MAG TPA: DOPA 4,5-dioxygenase family protein [Crinalium sp.]|jgi:DOPA 4,5-dioxygenase
MQDSLSIQNFHAHVYYDPETRDRAAQVRDELEKHFDVRLGRWHDKPVGPHPIAMYQVVFLPHLFGEIVPWLMLHRQGLNILLHPTTGDDVADHTDHALWLGKTLELNIDVLRPTFS